MYGRINGARAEHPAIRSTNRLFLTRQDGSGFNSAIFSAARWQYITDKDMVLVFVNLRDQPIGPEVFSIPRNVPLETQTGVQYQVRNLVADTPSAFLWPEPRSAEDILAQGVYVKFDLPNEVHYLRVERVQ